MTTITTKELRENMSQVVRDLKNGKVIALSYRQHVVGILQPVDGATQTLKPGSPEAIQRGLDELRANLQVPKELSDDPRSIKDQLADLREGGR